MFFLLIEVLVASRAVFLFTNSASGNLPAMKLVGMENFFTSKVYFEIRSTSLTNGLLSDFPSRFLDSQIGARSADRIESIPLFPAGGVAILACNFKDFTVSEKMDWSDLWRMKSAGSPLRDGA